MYVAIFEFYPPKFNCYSLGGCPFGPDEVWNIIWPATSASRVAIQKCPGLIEAEGSHREGSLAIYVFTYFYSVSFLYKFFATILYIVLKV